MHKNKNWLTVGIVAFILFLGLTVAVHLEPFWLTNFDTNIQQLLAGLVNPTRTQIFSTLAFFGSPAVDVVLTLLLAGAFWIRRDWLIAVWIALAQLGGDAVTFVVKELVRRPRPLGQLIKDTGFGYPSGHTFSTAILVLTILFIIVPLLEDQEVQLLVSLLAIVWFGVVAFSRVYLRDHFPSDVLASLLLAIAWWEVARVAYIYYLESDFKFLKTNLMKGEN
ncbi:phosphatase PAP2 family protein [Loigolactobacillus backii]|uniref:phosphatase PAP2 family protein n=1 Tax=Loigolactobacillus backii TaxID=375175 RepID=UPI0007F0E2F2|nr:phosphatase PAP2 family protein [Loigolactobacillus backii]ANK65595.1 hypothetical protein AYR54_10300 [Loigolactobacillus backii]ANK68067.1 hypothetical protein AYR55_10420 [Loigolactobacillus backii]MDA5387176.1 phosphatase PAP2 family protein [Loigolactobacillus backii]MDA5389750.1 phosphatase PAP2 family protein [Loigolactobacillus backii]PIO82310.1 phosphatidylglycerophosphatase [Loigolactobacillus backii]